MKIDRISIYPVTYTPRSGPFRLSGGRQFSEFAGVILKIDTDEGCSGWGEHASAPMYFDSLHGGAVAALRHLAPHLLGQDPTHVDAIRRLMDTVLRGHAYAKTAVDIACWDILGKVSGLPLSALLGGTYRTEIPILNFIPINAPDAMAARSRELHDAGFRTLQIKVGAGDWREDVARINAVLESGARFTNLMVDANGSWTPHEALLVLDAVDGLDFLLEQPCDSLESVLAVRNRSTVPIILDESLTSIEAVEHAHSLAAFDAAMLKLSRFGGISNLRVARDSCVRWGKAVTMEDMAGGAIITAAAAHLAASTPEPHLLSGSCTGQFMNESYGVSVEYPPGTGTAILPEGTGLGVEMDEAALGKPLAL